MKHYCPCGEGYEYTEEDLKWCTANTICPRCKCSLSLQHFIRETLDEESRKPKEERIPKNKLWFRDALNKWK